MTLAVKCPKCSKIHQVPPEWIGRHVQCHSCQQVMRVPSPGASKLFEELDEIVEQNEVIPAILSSHQETSAEVFLTLVEKTERGDSNLTLLLPALLGALFFFTPIFLIGIAFALIKPEYGHSIGEFLLWVGLGCGVFAGLWGVGIAFMEGPFHAFLCIFLPFYYLYFTLTRWGEMCQAFTLHLICWVASLLGWVVMVLAAANLR